MGNTLSSANSVSYKDVKKYTDMNSNNYVLVSTLADDRQHCLIPGTLPSHDEVARITAIIKEKRQRDMIVHIYGENYADNKIMIQYKKLVSIGFKNVYIYPGGMFEWLCLQEI